ncbi:MAG: protease modulator HflK family protein [Spirochaetes bacterium]|nr:protease modulator HflK family protein [Spirochaetota bacterium]
MTNKTKQSKTPKIKKSDLFRVKALLKASLLAMGVDLFLIILKYFLSRITGNAVLLADTLHSGADFAVSFMVLLSILVNYTFQGSKKAKHAEAFASFIISLLLIYGSIQMFLYIWANEAGSFILVSDVSLVTAFTGISLILFITLKMSAFKKETGKKYDSAAFTAEGDHTFSDFLSSVSVWATLLLGYFSIHIERLITFFIAIAVLNIGIRLLYKSLKLFGFKFKFLSRIIDIIHTDITSKLQKIKNRLTIIYRKINTKVTLLPLFIKKDIRLWINFNICIIIVLYFGTGVYKVLPYQTGVELFFGKVIEENKPGLHYHLPAPFGKKILVDTSVMVRLESGFRTDMNYTGEEPSMFLWENMHNEGRYTKVPEEALSIAGDENLIDINFICYYMINDPIQYSLNIENAHETLRNLLVYEIHSLCGQYALDQMLSSERKTMQDKLLSNMKKISQELSMGVEIKRIYMQESHPPVEVIAQYRSISSAREKKDEIIHKASAYANDQLPRSRGEADAQVLQAMAYSDEKINEAEGESERFLLKQQNFILFRNIQKIQIWWERMEKILKDKVIYILPEESNKRFFGNE